MATTPTQAQIEAAVTAYYRRQGDTIESRMAAALAAAADVPDQEKKPGQKPGLLPNGNTAAEIGGQSGQAPVSLTSRRESPASPASRQGGPTAAAEVGEQDELESGVLLTKAIDEVIAEDIEKERLQELVSQGIQIERQLRKELLTLGERCAQVAKASIIKNWGICPVPSALADAVDADLQALKDKA